MAAVVVSPTSSSSFVQQDPNKEVKKSSSALPSSEAAGKRRCSRSNAGRLLEGVRLEWKEASGVRGGVVGQPGGRRGRVVGVYPEGKVPDEPGCSPRHPDTLRLLQTKCHAASPPPPNAPFLSLPLGLPALRPQHS